MMNTSKYFNIFYKIQASIPQTTPLLPAPETDPSQANKHPLPPPPAAIQLVTLLGRAPSEHMQTLHALYAAQIATIVWIHESRGLLEVARRNIIVGLALQKSGGTDNVGLTEYERDVFQEVMSMIFEVLNRG